MSPETWIVAGVVTAFAAVVQGVTGAGFGLLSAPLLLLVEPRLVPAPVLAVSMVVLALVVRRDRHALSWSDLAPAVWGSLPGMIAGVWAAAVLAPGPTAIVLGITVAGAVVASWCGLRLPQGRGALSAAGVAAGFMGAVVATPGPPLALTYRPADPARLRATLSAFFLVVEGVTLVLLGAAGRLDAWGVKAVAALVPFAVAGYALSGPAAARVPARRLSGWVLTLTFVSAVLVVVRGCV